MSALAPPPAVHAQLICFQPADNYFWGPGPADLAAGDIDGDNRPDLAVVNREQQLGVHTLRYRLNTGNWSTPGQGFSGERIPAGIPITMLTGLGGDADIDLAGARQAEPFTFPGATVYINNGQGQFPPPFARYNFETGERVESIKTADVSGNNGDGKPDLICSSTGDFQAASVAILLGAVNEQQQRIFIGPERLPTDKLTRKVTIADFDGDGRPDIAASNGESSNVSILRRSVCPGG